MPRVAVILAAYNAAPYVGEAIRSVLEQTVGDLELVVVDDGSTDDTAAVAQTFLDDPRVTLLRQENLGQAAAKNRGIRESTAPIIGFCDADDYWDPRKLELQLPAFERPEVGVVYSREERFSENESGRFAIPYQAEECHSGRVTDALFVENFVPFGTALVRRSLPGQKGGIQRALPHGYRLGPVVAAVAGMRIRVRRRGDVQLQDMGRADVQ
jgi:glycosyltransferase involved in cell wall biosynthesis